MTEFTTREKRQVKAAFTKMRAAILNQPGPVKELKLPFNCSGLCGLTNFMSGRLVLKPPKKYRITSEQRSLVMVEIVAYRTKKKIGFGLWWDAIQVYDGIRRRFINEMCRKYDIPRK